MARKSPTEAAGSEEQALPEASAQQPVPAGMVECLTTQPCWQDGRPVPVGTPILLSKADAAYAESIGRVCRVDPAES